ncbi:MAG: hypothetical protein DRP08_03150 [Candidatus Aenigmatarchaeota archaeon]|nr:MAG: hypothetical protein DRP08_03150 [Candidatus Aenigmarchaeota archaeon]
MKILFIVSDLKDNRWLKYILEEFLRINVAEFKIRVCDVDQVDKSCGKVIYYYKNCVDKLSIPNRSYTNIRGNILWLSKEIFIIEDTIVNGWEGSCCYDIFWNAFVFLSRLEEYRNKKRIKSYAKNHPRKEKTTFDIPVVNNLFNEFELFIKNNFPELPFGSKKKPVIELSHDVDYIKKTFQLRLKQTAFNGYNTLKAFKNRSVFIHNAQALLSFLFSNTSCWCFDYWETIEQKYLKRSIFYIYVQTEKKDFKSWLIDPSYDVRADKKLQLKLRQLIYDGFEIGLHGSYHSAADEKRLVDEKDVLENILGRQVEKIRQHWLRYEEKITPVLHNKYFIYDSTIGWNDRMGFRSGCASRYRPYDHAKQKPFQYMVTPQVIMDSVIFDYGAERISLQTKKTLLMIKNIQALKTSHISISWHQRVCNNDYNWHKLYEKILKEHTGDCEYI